LGKKKKLGGGKKERGPGVEVLSFLRWAWAGSFKEDTSVIPFKRGCTREGSLKRFG